MGVDELNRVLKEEIVALLKENTVNDAASFELLSRCTRSSIRSIILTVVSTPTSEVIKTSSRLSNTSSSTLDLPTTTLASFLKTLLLD